MTPGACSLRFHKRAPEELAKINTFIAEVMKIQRTFQGVVRFSMEELIDNTGF